MIYLSIEKGKLAAYDDTRPGGEIEVMNLESGARYAIQVQKTEVAPTALQEQIARDNIMAFMNGRLDCTDVMPSTMMAGGVQGSPKYKLGRFHQDAVHYRVKMHEGQWQLEAAYELISDRVTRWYSVPVPRLEDVRECVNFLHLSIMQSVS